MEITIGAPLGWLNTNKYGLISLVAAMGMRTLSMSLEGSDALPDDDVVGAWFACNDDETPTDCWTKPYSV